MLLLSCSPQLRQIKEKMHIFDAWYEWRQKHHLGGGGDHLDATLDAAPPPAVAFAGAPTGEAEEDDGGDDAWQPDWEEEDDGEGDPLRHMEQHVREAVQARQTLFTCCC